MDFWGLKIDEEAVVTDVIEFLMGDESSPEDRRKFSQTCPMPMSEILKLTKDAADDILSPEKTKNLKELLFVLRVKTVQTMKEIDEDLSTLRNAKLFEQAKLLEQRRIATSSGLELKKIA
jgi:hypothetical protein